MHDVMYYILLSALPVSAWHCVSQTSTGNAIASYTLFTLFLLMHAFLSSAFIDVRYGLCLKHFAVETAIFRYSEVILDRWYHANRSAIAKYY